MQFELIVPYSKCSIPLGGGGSSHENICVPTLFSHDANVNFQCLSLLYVLSNFVDLFLILKWKNIPINFYWQSK